MFRKILNTDTAQSLLCPVGGTIIVSYSSVLKPCQKAKMEISAKIVKT